MRRVFCLLLVVTASLARASLDYSLAIDQPSRSAKIALALDVRSTSQQFEIPAWCPGFYVLRKYQDKIFDVRARIESGQEVPVTKSGLRSWNVELDAPQRIVLSYRVLGDDGGLGFFGTQVDASHGFINGPSAFMYPVGRKDEACKLAVEVPSGWDIATSMSKDDGGKYLAANYDELIDQPLQLGKMARKSFFVNEIPFEVVVASPRDKYPDMNALAASLATISYPAIKLFGGAPFKRYTFFIHLAIGEFSGGLEHRASNVIATSFQDPLDLGTLAGHEFFHAWNVKQIRPFVLGPFDYTKPVRTRNLWFSEGVTDYYAHMLYYTAGGFDENSLLRALSDQIDELQTSRTRLDRTLEDACLNTWESGGFGFGDLSYYTKGLLCGLLLDAAILDATSGKKSLDDVLRVLYDKCLLPKAGFAEDEIRKTINEVAGIDLTDLYNASVRSTKELPYENLRAIGLELISGDTPVPQFGFDLGRQGEVRDVLPQVQAMGLLEGDIVQEIQGEPLVEDTWRDTAASPYSVSVVRRGLPLTLTLHKVELPTGMMRLRRASNLNGRQRQLFSRWINRLEEGPVGELLRP